MGYQINLKKQPVSIAIPLDFVGPQPSHFGANPAVKTPMVSGDFVGDTTLGGSCNADEITMNPHCNGTHTESISHVINELICPADVVKQPMVLACLITVEPTSEAGNEVYEPALKAQDKVLTKEMFTVVRKTLHKNIKALIIRTLPNTNSKFSNQYGKDVQPAFFTNDAMLWLVDNTQIEHLLVDMPSIDRLHDDGKLSNHRIFWNIEAGSHESSEEQYRNKTITEMIYVPNDVEDGEYLLNLQLPRLNLNAVPSNPVLYRIAN